MSDNITRVDEDEPVPGHRNYLVYCDESGMGGEVYYGFGSLWMPWERRGDFAALIDGLRAKHGYEYEIKWKKVKSDNEAFYRELIEQFFQRTWLMFHCVIVRRGYTDQAFHKDFDEEKRKRFSMLIKNKIKFFSGGDPSKAYHVRVDPLPSRYPKADEAAFKIVGNTLKKELDVAPLKSLITRDSKQTRGIQLADVLLGATMSDWQEKASAPHKLSVKQKIAEHLGWPDLKADTKPHEWKFNIWYFYDPSPRMPREIETRDVKLLVPMPPLPRRKAIRPGTTKSPQARR